jgi:carboxymethylenebutenolidase
MLRRANILLCAADGHTLHAHRAEPEGVAVAGLVVLQEIFGVNRHIREVCDDFAERGYCVVSPALFDRVRPTIELGYDAPAIEQGRALRSEIGWDAALCDLAAAIGEASRAGPVGVVGYCWGGTLAFLAATRLPGVRCAVSYYGGQTVPFAHERPQAPVLFHFGEFDPRIPPEDRETIRRHNPDMEMHVFPADHGFNCDHRPEWHEPSAERALQITLDFLARHLRREVLMSPRR